MLKVICEINESKLQDLIYEYIHDNLSIPITKDDIRIEVKSKQNYKSEWEVASFRAIIEKSII